MSRLKSIWLPVCVMMAAAALPAQSAAQHSHIKVDEAEAKEVRAKLNGKTLLDLMETIAEEDPQYNGPALQYPRNKLALRKGFLPEYFETIDNNYAGGLTHAGFTVGGGDQTPTLNPVTVTALLILFSRLPADMPINEEFLGSLTGRELFTALDLDSFSSLRVAISYPDGRKRGIEHDTSWSSNFLSIQGKDKMGLWVYSLEMSLSSDDNMIAFRTSDGTETFKIDGMTTDEIMSIKVNDDFVYRNTTAEKPSDILRREMGL